MTTIVDFSGALTADGVCQTLASTLFFAEISESFIQLKRNLNDQLGG
jgi:hypothetical protein